MNDPSNSNALALLQTLQEKANALRSQISTGGANRLSVDNDGNFIGVDGYNLGPEIECIVLDFITAHRYYPRPYNANKPEPPVCFAFGRDLNTLAPDATSPEPQNDMCGIPGREGCCPWNEWKSDARGTGKACKNTREIAVITADQFELPPEEQQILVYSVPPTGIKTFDGAISYILRTYGTGPIRNVMRITAVKQATYVTVNFQPTDELNPLLEAHVARAPECEELLYRLPDVSGYEPPRQPAQPTRGVRR